MDACFSSSCEQDGAHAQGQASEGGRCQLSAINSHVEVELVKRMHRDLGGTPIMFTMKMITKPLHGHKEGPHSKPPLTVVLRNTEDKGGEGLSPNVYVK